jgi:hypothetical protein
MCARSTVDLDNFIELDRPPTVYVTLRGIARYHLARMPGRVGGFWKSGSPIICLHQLSKLHRASRVFLARQARPHVDAARRRWSAAVKPVKDLDGLRGTRSRPIAEVTQLMAWRRGGDRTWSVDDTHDGPHGAR